jgi:fucose permease
MSPNLLTSLSRITVMLSVKIKLIFYKMSSKSFMGKEMPPTSGHHPQVRAMSQKAHFRLSFFFNFLYSCVHTMIGALLPSSPTPSLSPHSLLLPPTPSLPSRNCFALLSSFVEERV